MLALTSIGKKRQAEQVGAKAPTEAPFKGLVGRNQKEQVAPTQPEKVPELQSRRDYEASVGSTPQEANNTTIFDNTGYQQRLEAASAQAKAPHDESLEEGLEGRGVSQSETISNDEPTTGLRMDDRKDKNKGAGIRL